MVKIEGPSESERLDEMVHRLAREHGLKVDVTGWTRKAYHLYLVQSRLGPEVRVAALDSLAPRSGEVCVLDDRGMPFAQALAQELEQAFAIAEARIKR